MTPLLVTRGGVYVRVADPNWDDPLNGEYAKARGGRWNAPGAFPVVYLNGDVRVARANVLQRFEGLPYGPEDLEPSAGPVLVSTAVPEDEFVDVVSDAGCIAVGLPPTYPVDEEDAPVPHEACRPVGQGAWDAGPAGHRLPERGAGGASGGRGARPVRQGRAA